MQRVEIAANRKRISRLLCFNHEIDWSRRFSHPMKLANFSKFLVLIGLAMTTTNPAAGSVEEDKKNVAALDTQYQAAVEKNDAETMARIQHGNMVLVLSNGTVQSGVFLARRARD